MADPESRVKPLSPIVSWRRVRGTLERRVFRFPLGFTQTMQDKPHQKRLSQAMKSRSSRFAPIVSGSPQNSCRFPLIYYRPDESAEDRSMQIEAKLQALGLVLPVAPKTPPGFKFSFAWTRRRGNRIYLSGHAAQAPDGSYTGAFGKVPTEVSLEAAQEAARGTALSMLAVPEKKTA
jgi:hypothetical protein